MTAAHRVECTVGSHDSSFGYCVVRLVADFADGFAIGSSPGPKKQFWLPSKAAPFPGKARGQRSKRFCLRRKGKSLPGKENRYPIRPISLARKGNFLPSKALALLGNGFPLLSKVFSYLGKPFPFPGKVFSFPGLGRRLSGERFSLPRDECLTVDDRRRCREATCFHGIILPIAIRNVCAWKLAIL